MKYEDYIKCKNDYLEILNKYDNIICQLEQLFSITQPHSSSFEEKVRSEGQNVFDIYLIKKDEQQLDDELEKIKKILNERKNLLKLKEEELRKSKVWVDIIYTYYFLDGLSIRKIELKIPFSKSQIYRIVKKIKLGQNAID